MVDNLRGSFCAAEVEGPEEVSLFARASAPVSTEFDREVLSDECAKFQCCCKTDSLGAIGVNIVVGFMDGRFLIIGG